MNKTSQFLSAAALAFASLSASASLTPTYDQYGAHTFGTLSGATFGGSGISNTAVAINTFAGKNVFGGSSGTVTLGLSVTSRYANQPSVTNNGAGAFTAAVGVDKTSTASILEGLATWNIDYYIGGVSTFLGVSPYTFKLLVDVDPSAGENFKTLYLSANSQDSINIGASVNELLGGYLFDPTLTGQYSLVLEAVQGNTIVGKTSALVNVNKVPEPASLALAGVALCGAAFASRRRKA